MSNNIDKMIEDSLNYSSEEDTYYFNNEHELCILDNNGINEEEYNLNQGENKNPIGKFCFIMRKIRIPMIVCIILILIKVMQKYFPLLVETCPKLILLSPMLVISFLIIGISIYGPIRHILKRKRCTTPVVCEVVKTSLVKESNGEYSQIDVWYVRFKYYYNGILYHNSKTLPTSIPKPQEYSRFKILINPYNPIEYCDENNDIEFSIKSYILNILFNLIPILIVLVPLWFFTAPIN